jgi:hypothetical protein
MALWVSRKAAPISLGIFCSVFNRQAFKPAMPLSPLVLCLSVNICHHRPFCDEPSHWSDLIFSLGKFVVSPRRGSRNVWMPQMTFISERNRKSWALNQIQCIFTLFDILRDCAYFVARGAGQSESHFLSITGSRIKFPDNDRWGKRKIARKL